MHDDAKYSETGALQLYLSMVVPVQGHRKEFSFCGKVQTLGKKASDLGVTLGLEIVNRYETNVCNTAVQGMELLADIDEPSLRVHLDSYHMNIEENSMGAAVKTCGKKLGCSAL